MKPNLRFAILAILKDRQTGGKSENEWAQYTALASSIKTSLDFVARAGDELSRDGFVESRRRDDQTEVRITPAGRSHIEAWLRDQGASVSAPLIESEPVPTYEYDLFVSHASEGVDFVDPIVDALRAAKLTVWYDRDQLKRDAELIDEMDRAIAASRSFLIFPSQIFFKKLYARSELSTVLNLNLSDAARRIIIVLYGISQAGLRTLHPTLANRRNIDSALFGIDTIVSGILHDFVTGVDGLDSTEKEAALPGLAQVGALGQSPYIPGSHEAPYDSLDDSGIGTTRPSLEIEWCTPGWIDGVFSIQWAVRNIGNVDAIDVAIFMPGLKVYGLGHMKPGEQKTTTLRFDDRYAYFEIMKPPVSTVIEFADNSKRIYRQYATVNAFPKWDGSEAAYITTQLGYPYLVSQRIVTIDDDDDRFHRSRAIGWDPE